MRESRPPGSVRGVLSNEHPYRDSREGAFGVFEVFELTRIVLRYRSAA